MSTPRPRQHQLIAFIVYPGLTLLDLVGPLQTLVDLGEPYQTITVGVQREAMPTDTRLSIVPEASFTDVLHPFGVIVPGGGAGAMRAMADPIVQDYLQATATTAEVVGSVCTGSLVLAAAGLLEGRKATTHWAYAHYLSRLGAIYERCRWVEDGKYITAAGVSAGIDMALHLAARLTNAEHARQIQVALEYDPQPPFGLMDWSLANVERYWAGLGDRDLTQLLEGRPDLISRLVD
jgi:transcriptional regulator GlxA family with amidase domain